MLTINEAIKRDGTYRCVNYDPWQLVVLRGVATWFRGSEKRASVTPSDSGMATLRFEPTGVPQLNIRHTTRLLLCDTPRPK